MTRKNLKNIIANQSNVKNLIITKNMNLLKSLTITILALSFVASCNSSTKSSESKISKSKAKESYHSYSKKAKRVKNAKGEVK